MDPGFSGLQNSQGNSVVFPGEKVNRKDPFALPLNTGMRQTGTRTGEAGSGLGGGVQSPIICSSFRRTLQNLVRFNWAEKAWGLCVLLTGVQSQTQTQASYQTSLNLKEIHDPSLTGLLGQLKEILWSPWHRV